MTDTLDILRGAYRLIERPEHWCQGEYARTSGGRHVSIMDEDACAFCLTGALVRAAGGIKASRAASDTVLQVLGDHRSGIPRYNDTHSHLDVLRLLSRAIALEEAS